MVVLQLNNDHLGLRSLCDVKYLILLVIHECEDLVLIQISNVQQLPQVREGLDRIDLRGRVLLLGVRLLVERLVMVGAVAC